MRGNVSRMWAAAVGLGLSLSATRAQQPPTGNQRDSVSYDFHSLHVVGGGFITGILFHPTVRGLAYCRTDIGGAYRWEGSTRQWTPLSAWIPRDDANLIGVESLAVDPAHPDDLYLAAGTYTHAESPNGALLRSHDRGRTFETIPLPFKLGANEEGRFAGERLALDPVHPGLLYLGTRLDGLWRSSDSGTTWIRVSNLSVHTDNGVGIPFVLFGPKRDGKAGAIYVGVSAPGDSLFVSEDAGTSWQLVNGAPRGLLPNHAALQGDGAIVLTYANKPGPNGMTSGAVWRRSKEGAWKDVTPETSGAGGGYGGLALDPERPGTINVSTMDRWTPGDTLFHSVDGGKHWVSLREKARMNASLSPWLRAENGTLSMGHWIGALAVDPFDSDHMMYGTGETIWTTNDARKADHGHATQWNVGAEGIEETAVLSLTSPPSGPPLYAGLGDIGCFRADDIAPGVSPSVMGPPRLANCDSVAVASKKTDHAVMSGRVWSGQSHGGYSEDSGRTWKRFASEPDGAGGGGRIAISSDASAVIWTTAAGVFGTKDNGTTWQRLAEGGVLEVIADTASEGGFYLMDRSQGVLSKLVPGSGPIQLQTGLSHGLHMVAGADELWMYGLDGVLRLKGGQLTRLARVRATYALGLGKPMLAAAPETLFLSGNVHGENGMYRSADQGSTWVRIDDHEHEYGEVSPISGDPRVAGRVYVGTNGQGVIVGEPR